MNILQKIDKLKDDLSQQITQAVIDQNMHINTLCADRDEHYGPKKHNGQLLISPPPSAHIYTRNCPLTALSFNKSIGQITCTVPGKKGEIVQFPFSHLGLNSRIAIYDWLKAHAFLKPEDPWRCRECGSIAVEEQVWRDVNTEEATSTAQNRDEFYCANCDDHDWLIRESELMQEIGQWWDRAEAELWEAICGLSRVDFGTEKQFTAACKEFWDQLTTQEKIDLWNENKES